MADTKITALTALTAADPANDVIPIVDVSDTSMAASGTTKKISVNNILGASGTATLASATITGDLTVDTSTLKVDSTNNRVGIVTATPSFPLDVSGSGVTNSPIRLISASGTNVRFDTGRSYTVNRNWIVGCDEVAEGVFAIIPSTTLGGSTFTNPVYRVSSAGIHTFLDGAGGTRMTLDASGNLAFPTGKGIDFSAVTGGSGTATANVLNDYEEGTFTPTVSGSSSAGVGVYSVQYGRYTKIGRNVFVQAYIDWSAHTGTGSMQFTNLPFTSENVSNGYSSVAIGEISGITLTASNYPTASIPPNTSRVNLGQSPTGGGVASAVTIDPSGYIFFSGSYQA